MNGEDVPRRLPERTGRHRCISCLGDVPAEEYFRNDYLCDSCSSREAFPLASTPGAREESEAEPQAEAGGQ